MSLSSTAEKIEGASEPAFSLRELTPSIGAEITGIDAGAGLDESTFIAIRDAIHRYAVIVLREQTLTPAAQVALLRRLGPTRTEPYSRYFVLEAPQLMVLSNMYVNGEPIGAMDVGGMWHTDKLHTPRPNMYTMLYALNVPERDGKALGDTVFANVADAYDALPDATRRRINGLRAVHNLTCSLERKRRKGVLNRDLLTPTDMVSKREAEHPLVAVHPITGRKCILATEGHTARIVGLPEDESETLLAELWAHIVSPQFIYRHSWRLHDLMIWDNRSSQHLATFDYGELPRRMYRGETVGPAPRGIIAGI